MQQSIDDITLETSLQLNRALAVIKLLRAEYFEAVELDEHLKHDISNNWQTITHAIYDIQENIYAALEYIENDGVTKKTAKNE